MTTPINLNKARKAKARSDKEKKAAENRARHGLSKSEKSLRKAESDKLRRALDAARKDS